MIRHAGRKYDYCCINRKAYFDNLEVSLISFLVNTYCNYYPVVLVKLLQLAEQNVILAETRRNPKGPLQSKDINTTFSGYVHSQSYKRRAVFIIYMCTFHSSSSTSSSSSGPISSVAPTWSVGRPSSKECASKSTCSSPLSALICCIFDFVIS